MNPDQEFNTKIRNSLARRSIYGAQKSHHQKVDILIVINLWLIS